MTVARLGLVLDFADPERLCEHASDVVVHAAQICPVVDSRFQ